MSTAAPTVAWQEVSNGCSHLFVKCIIRVREERARSGPPDHAAAAATLFAAPRRKVTIALVQGVERAAHGSIQRRHRVALTMGGRACRAGGGQGGARGRGGIPVAQGWHDRLLEIVHGHIGDVP